MNTLRAIRFLLVFGLLGENLPAQDPLTPDPRTEAARAMIQALVKEDYKAAGKDFDDTMKKVMPADKLETTWKTLLKQVGPFKKQLGTRTEKVKKYDIVLVTCQFEKLLLDVRVVFDSDKHIAGLGFLPAKGAYDFKPPSYAKPDSFRESKVVVGSGEWALPGTLTLPREGGPFPAVVLVHGSGPQDRDETIGPNKPLRDLAWGLASQGIAVLRYEKRTREHGKKLVDGKDTLTLKEEVIDDTLAAVAVLRKEPAVDGKRLFVLGHSLGAVAAPRIGERDPALAGLILLAGNTRPLEDVILDQITYIASLPNSGLDKDELAKIQKQVEKVKDRKLTRDTPAAELPLGVPAVYWLALRDYDQAATAGRLKQPLLLLQGERDYQVTMADFAGWKKALAGHKEATFKSYPRLNHLFMEGEGKAKPEEYNKAGHVAREVVDDIAGWIKKH
jgi:dienelactone hydrolase